MAILNPPMSILKNRVLTIVSSSLGNDYQQSGSVFYKFYKDFFHLVEVQFLRTDPQATAMTIYFGVVVPEVLKLLWKEKYKADDYKKLSARNGVFNCNINDLITDFKGRPKIKYWDLRDENSVFDEIDVIVKSKLLPFIRQFESLENLDSLVTQINFPFKNSSDIPVMILGLKYLLGKNEEFFELAEHLKRSNNHFSSLVDDLVRKKSFE